MGLGASNPLLISQRHSQRTVSGVALDVDGLDGRGKVHAAEKDVLDAVVL